MVNSATHSSNPEELEPARVGRRLVMTIFRFGLDRTGSIRYQLKCGMIACHMPNARSGSEPQNRRPRRRCFSLSTPVGFISRRVVGGLARRQTPSWRRALVQLPDFPRPWLAILVDGMVWPRSSTRPQALCSRETEPVGSMSRLGCRRAG
jgi:hypothetical protein